MKDLFTWLENHSNIILSFYMIGTPKDHVLIVNMDDGKIDDAMSIYKADDLDVKALDLMYDTSRIFDKEE